MEPLFRSQLYVPAKKPGMLQNAPYMGADSVIIDLEDAIALEEKDAARVLTAHALRSVDFGGVGRIVRVNAQDTEFYADDMDVIIPCCPDAIRLPKVESADAIREVDERMTRLEQKAGIPVGTVKVHAMLETALGVMNAMSVASAAKRVTAISLGGQDLAADMGILRTNEGTELLIARGLVVLAARAAKIMAFDTPFTDVDNTEGLLKESRFIVQIGFAGKAAIHPSQSKFINAAFAPDEKTLRKAIAVVRGAREAARKGLGVCVVNGKMVDKPVVEQAESVVLRAKLAGMEGVEHL